MNGASIRVAILLLLAAPRLVSAEEPPPPTAAEIREAKLYDAIAEMIRRRDRLLKKFAVVLHGEKTTVGRENGPIETPVLCARVVDRSRDFDLHSEYYVLHGSLETGAETLRIGDKHFARAYGGVFVNPYMEKPKGMKLSEFNLQHGSGGGHDPFDDYVLGGNNLLSETSYRAIENIILKKYKFEGTEDGLGDRLIAHWSYYPIKNLNQRMRWELDPANEMMIVRNSLENLDHKDWFRETRVSWKKHGQMLLPDRITTAGGVISSPGVTEEYTFKCLWLVGDEVPDAVFTSEDHLAALLDHFGITHTLIINGSREFVQHQLPDDLYEDAKKN